MTDLSTLSSPNARWQPTCHGCAEVAPPQQLCRRVRAVSIASKQVTCGQPQPLPSRWWQALSCQSSDRIGQMKRHRHVHLPLPWPFSHPRFGRGRASWLLPWLWISAKPVCGKGTHSKGKRMRVRVMECFARQCRRAGNLHFKQRGAMFDHLIAMHTYCINFGWLAGSRVGNRDAEATVGMSRSCLVVTMPLFGTRLACAL